MKTPTTNPFLLGVAVFAFALANHAAAQTNAYDDAYHYSHNSTTWYTNFNTPPGLNHGFGYLPWVVRTNGPANHGFFTTRNGNPLPAISSPTNFVDAPGNNTNAHVFGLFANGAPGQNSAVAYRAFSNSLDTTVAFKIQWENLGIGFANTNLAGFVLRNGNATNDTSDYFTGLRFAFYYIGGGTNSFVFWDGNGVQAIGIPFTTTPLACEFTLRPGDQYRFVVRNLVSGAILVILDNQPLAGAGTIDSFALFAHQTSANQNFNRFQVVSTSLTPPTILNVIPLNGAIYEDAATTNVSFEVDTIGSTIASNGVTLLLNDVLQTNLTVNTVGQTNQLIVSNNVPLTANAVYNVTIIAVDSNGNRTTNTSTFNTWRSDNPFIEAEDYNYSAGGYIPNSFPNPYNAYANLFGTNGIDFGESDPAGTNNAYRPGDLPQIQIASDVDHAGYVGFGYTDYNLGFTQFGEWLNYTRVMSNVTYNVYARMAGFGGNGVMQIERLANPTATASNQPAAALGTCIAPHTGGTQIYTFVPLKDFFSNPVQIRFSGTHTFRCRTIGDSGSYNLSYLIFVPTNTTTLRPYLSAGYPYPGATGVVLDNNIVFTIANRETAVNPGSIQLFLNNTNVTPYVTLSNNSSGTVVTCMPPNFFPSNATNILRVVFTDNDGSPVTTTNTWQFTTVNAMSTVLSPAYALPVGSFTQRGFSLRLNKAEDAAPNPPFSATIARAELQLAGQITNINTSQPYPNLANGGPNADGSFAETNVINYDINATTTGTFPGDTAFPYIPANAVNNNIALEGLMYLQLTNGNYVFVVRSDDGFKLTAGPTPGDTNFVMGFFDGGRGNTTPSTFYVTVVTNGLYPMRFLYYQAGSGGNVELYTTTGGVPILINDPNNVNAIKSFQAVASAAAPVTLLYPAHTGDTTTFSFMTQSGHTHYVEYKTNLNAAGWTLLTTLAGNGSLVNVTDSSATNATRFYRVRSQ